MHESEYPTASGLIVKTGSGNSGSSPLGKMVNHSSSAVKRKLRLEDLQKSHSKRASNATEDMPAAVMSPAAGPSEYSAMRRQVNVGMASRGKISDFNHQLAKKELAHQDLNGTAI